jgi:hypothetical protein
MTSARVAQLTERLQQLLDAAADDRPRQYWERYLKGTARFRGVPMAAIRTTARTLWHTQQLRAWPTPQLLALAQHWIGQPLSEDKLAGTLLLAEQLAGRLTLKDGHALARPLAEGQLADWSSCDWYATKALHDYLTTSPEQLPARAELVAGWSAAANLWQRRAAVVAFVKLAPQSPPPFHGLVQLLLAACANNLVSPDRFAHTVPAGCYGSCHAATPTRWHGSSRRTRSCRWRRPGWPPHASAPDPTGGADPRPACRPAGRAPCAEVGRDGSAIRGLVAGRELRSRRHWPGSSPEAHGGARRWWREPLRVEHRGEDLHAVDQAGTRTGAVGAGIDGDDRLDPGQLGPPQKVRLASSTAAWRP